MGHEPAARAATSNSSLTSRTDAELAGDPGSLEGEWVALKTWLTAERLIPATACHSEARSDNFRVACVPAYIKRPVRMTMRRAIVNDPVKR